MYNLFDLIYSILGTSWLFYMLSFPSKFGGMKIALLVILNLFCFLELVIYKKKINTNLISALLIFELLFLYFGLNSELNNYQISFGIVNVYYFLPIVAVNLSQIFTKKHRIDFLFNGLVLITLFICIYNSLNLLSNLKLLPSNFTFESEISGSFKLTDETIEARIANETSLIYLLPFLICYKLSSVKKNKLKKWVNIVLNIIIFLSIPIVFFSGRRALQFSVIITPFILFLVHIFTSKLNVLLTFLILFIKQFFVAIVIVFFLSIGLKAITPLYNPVDSFGQTLFRAIDVNSSSGKYKTKQAQHLFYNWSNSILAVFQGNGLASFSETFIANKTSKYSYEMTYFALLFQTGLIGVFYFFLCVFFICMKHFKTIISLPDNVFFISSLVGFICCILAGSSNPFLYYPWIWIFALIPYSIRAAPLL